MGRKIGVGNHLHDEVGQTEAKFIAGKKRGLFDRGAVHVRAVPGAEILNRDFGSVERDAAVPPADPAVVDSQRDIVSAADFGRELVQHDFTRAGQWVLADEAKFHGSLAGEKTGGQQPEL